MLDKKLVILPAIIIIGLFFFVFNCIYIITEKEKGILLRFGQVVYTDIKPGLHVKLPLVEKVMTFDGRLQSLSLPSSRFLTQEKKAVIVDAYVKWRIANVQLYYKATSGNQDRTRSLLGQRIESRLRNKFGSLTLTDVVSGQRDELMKDITKNVDIVAENTLGVQIIDVRVKQIDLPVTVSESVFNRMQSERSKEAREYRAQGKEAADIIHAGADKQKTIILANAQKEADIIRGQGDALAASIYAKAYGADEKFYDFYQSLIAYQNIFSSPSDLIILDSNNPFFNYMTNKEEISK